MEGGCNMTFVFRLGESDLMDVVYFNFENFSICYEEFGT